MMPDRIPSFGPAPECPALETLLNAATDAAVKQHLESCAHCRTELAMFQEFEAATPRPEETADLAWVNAELSRKRSETGPSVADRIRAWFTLPRLSMAATALAVLLAAALYLPNRRGTRLPDQQESSAWRSGSIAALAPAGDLDRAPASLQWEAATGAASYHVRLLEVDGTEIWSTDTTATTVALPGALAAKMIGGRAFQWDAVARDNGGRKIASTVLQSFHILVTAR
jgi:hypothetical protein